MSAITDQICTGRYGVQESNGITDEIHAFRDSIDGEVALDDPALARIVRLRLLGERGYPMFDLSYCYGVLKDGTAVRVQLPVSRFPVRGFERSVVEMCKSVGVYGKGLGILDPSVVSILR